MVQTQLLVKKWGRGYDLWSKNYHFLFLLLFDPEACNPCKNTIKLLNLRVLPYRAVFCQADFVYTLNNFVGITGLIFYFNTDHLFPCRGF